jgi:hypothetical protein
VGSGGVETCCSRGSHYVEPHNTYNKAITFVHQVGYLFHITFKMHGHKNLKHVGMFAL